MENLPAKAVSFFVALFALFLFSSCDLARAQSTDTPSGPVTLSPDDLQQLVAPIALYPDPLVALILPASTVPTDIVLAERFLTNGGDADDIDDQNWDDNVKGLARYPDVLQMMSDNLDWTNQLGAAVLYQQADVMAAIQAQREKAQALGNLVSTPQQTVGTDNGIIEIYPANPQLIYVPEYDPQIVYLQPAPPVFGIGFNIGIWIGGGCDWRSHRIYSRGYYRPGYGWRPGYHQGGPVWRPNPSRPKPRPPYRPGRPGSHLPGFRPQPVQPRPPGGNRPGIPGKPKPNPDWGGSKPGHGNRPNPGTNPPGKPNRPGRPQIQPVPQPLPKPTQPGAGRPDKPATKPAPIKPRPTPEKPSTRPVPDKPAVRPAPQPPKTRPAPERPSARPMPSLPPARPTPSHPGNPKRPEVRPQPRPTPRPAAPARPARTPANKGPAQGAPQR
jgi:Protein of unknown function (DUF3300)